ncbi:MAG: hypothetical protein R3D31_03390 [Hyphomicrobiaceae bacterium]
MRDWLQGTPENDWVSMGVASDGSYGVPKGLIFGFPATCFAGRWSIVQGLELNPMDQLLFDATRAELLKEYADAIEILEQAH